MKGWMIAAAAATAVAVTAGVVFAVRSSGPDVPPKPKGLTKYDSEAYEYRGLVIVLDRRDPDSKPKQWRWRVFDKPVYGNGRDIEGKQRATQFGKDSRAKAYRSAVNFIDEKILGGN